jgi:beta-glucosidase/6-phospho-beta-glucosidase/beta-galactosidase
LSQPVSGAIPFIGAFESTYQPAHDRDVVETTQHDVRWRHDLSLLASCGVRQVRYPLRWHRIEPEPGRFDWSHTDEVLGFMHDDGFAPIVDLLHHTSYPRWLDGGFASPHFADAYLRFVEAVAHRYPWLGAYTVFNEPFTTFLLCGQEGVWPPHHHGMHGLVRLATNVLPGITRANRALHDLLPHAEHVHVEAAERHTWSTPDGEAFAAMTNDRRFLFTDLLVGRTVEPGRPYVRELLQAGGEDLLLVEPGHVDVLGLDYYAHNQWHWTGPGHGTNVPPDPVPLADLIVEYTERYRLPTVLGETNIRGFASDRASWLKYTLEQCEAARDRGADVRGYCWFPFIDSADWGSLLRECEGAIDPVGVFWLDEHLERRASSMSTSYAMAARGTPGRALPAYRLRRPVATWLEGWLPQMSHWEWQLPPGETCSHAQDPEARIELRSTMSRQLVVLSHLRWAYVWQRPQHLISRLARDYERTWFVEEPSTGDVSEPTLRTEDHGKVTRVWLELPHGVEPAGYDTTASALYADALPTLLGDGHDRTVWLYTPMALDVARAIEPTILVYDVMDDLAAFRFAPAGLLLRQRQALRDADVVFTGGRSLHRGVVEHRGSAHCFPSGVEPEHYEAAIAQRAARHARRGASRRRPVAGYVGVIDERIDLDLVAELAAALPDWDVQLVGPVTKIDPDTLPVAGNVHHLGAREYAELPAVMADFDVALMPFALNEATRSISPTKTLEYLAAGLPVVSTRVPDVVADYAGVVQLRDDGHGFAEACRAALDECPKARAERCRSVLRAQHWDTIAARMSAILDAARRELAAAKDTA